jgi:mono/diheme cytochrome c family protein
MRFFFPALLIIFFFACGHNEEEDRQKQFAPEANYKIENATSGVSFSAEEFDGMRLFMKFCNKCHPGGEKGRGPSLNDKKLPNFLIHWQVRLGGGKMPDFKKDEISKEELNKIVSFLRLMREKVG